MATDTAMERALRRMRKKRRNNPVNKKQIIISLVICLAVALFAAVFIHMEQTKQKSMQITAGNTHNVGNSYRNIVYKGQEYQYNNRISMPVWTPQASWKLPPSMEIKPGQTVLLWW